MRYHVITALLVVAAVVCYFAGFGEGIVPLIAAYLILELTVAFRFVARRRKRRLQER